MLKAVVNSPIRSGDQTINNGNLVIGTAGKGIDFSASSHAAGMTSELLSDYEEGTWTPNVGGDATYNVQSGHYTKIGRQVTLRCDMEINVLGTGSNKYLQGLPFTPAQPSAGSMGYYSSLSSLFVIVNPIAVTFNAVIFETATVATNTLTDESVVFVNGSRVIFTVTYFV